MPVDPKLRALVRMFVKAADGSTPTLYAAIRNQGQPQPHSSNRAQRC